MSEESAQALPTSAQFGAGSKIAGYVIEEKIGQGGMAVVFRAHDERLDRTVALKLLAPALAEDEAFRQRFIRESRAAAAVDDPHIIPVYDAGEASGGLFIAMRFVRGGDVRSLLDRAGPLPVERVMAIVSQAASALDSAHAKGLVHRDVKPANMLLDRDRDDDRPDHVYLADFGLSKLSLQSTGLTDTGTFLGTLDYIAPEQIEGKLVDGRADQYSLACAAFELLTGSTPFRREDRQELMAVMYAQLSEPPPALSSRRPDLPAAADYVFARALAKAPADRYLTCREFTSALRGALALAPSQTPSAPIARSLTEAVQLSYAATSGPTAAPSTSPPAPPGPLAQPGPPGGYDLYNQGHQVVPQRPKPQRLTPILLIVVSVLVAAGIIGGALVFRTHGSPGAPSSGNSPNSPNATSGSGNTTPNGSASSQPQNQGTSSAPSSGGRTSGNQGAAAPPTGSAGFQLVRTVSPRLSVSISSVSWNFAGSQVATSDKNGSTYLWSPSTGQLARVPFTESGQTYATALSPDGSLLASGYSTGTTYLWNTQSGQLVATLNDPGPSTGKEVDSVAFSPDGKTLVTSDGNSSVNLWHVPSGGHGTSLKASLTDPGGTGVFSTVFGSQGVLATGDYDGHVYLWNAETGTPTPVFSLPGGSSSCGSSICSAISGLAFSHDGSVLAAANESGSAELWSVPNGTGTGFGLPSVAAGQPIWGLSFSGSGLLAAADNNGHSYLYQVASATLKATLRGQLTDPNSGSQGVGSLGFSPDGRYLVTGDTNGNAYVWHLS
ncbi:MAG TPA: serine/threonine-protein kinase [Streptosporangiaceae bacterium]|nr:serine/threonine-protein kinase [Streptosporangiaceae bacterium]